MGIYERSRELLSCRKPFGFDAEDCGKWDVTPPESQMVLRMLVRRPGVWLQLPPELEWAHSTIMECDGLDCLVSTQDHFLYLTVRCGVVDTVTDDEWHVDGYSERVPHTPERNYLWCDRYGTEVLHQRFELPLGFDPLQHNIHTYFQDRATGPVSTLKPGRLWRVDPYVIHRRPPEARGKQRKFLRVSYVPIEIEDDTCTQNPLLPTGPYGREDVRKSLRRYV